VESERKERRQEIEAVVRTLPTAYRELIILRHAQDLTYEEIVEVTGRRWVPLRIVCFELAK